MIGAMNYHRHKGATLKKEETARCAMWAMAGKFPALKVPVRLLIRWIEPNNRRDLDNISGGLKFILDGLVTSGKLINDTRQWVKGITHEFPDADHKNPRVEVEIETLDA